MNNGNLTVIERAALALGTSEREQSLRALVAESASIIEIKNAAGRDQCHGALMKLRGTRVEIEKAGKTAREDATAFSKAVIAEEKRLVAITETEENRLLGVRDSWDEAREAEKRAKAEAEQRRVAAIREHIDDIRAIAMRAAGRMAAEIEVEIDDLRTLGIDLSRFAELTGEAEAARGMTLDKLRDLHAAAVAQEAEQARLAAEREALERERAALAEQQRQEAEARAERERIERERYAAEEAQRRAQQEREDAERRAAHKAEEERLAEQRAEMALRQAELDRAEREQREREEAALREAAEASDRAERERLERERAENCAARMAPEPTSGNWKVGRGAVVTDQPIPGCIGGGFDDIEHYGGYLIAESIYRPADAHLIAAAPELLKALHGAANYIDTLGGDSKEYRIAIAKATCQPATEHSHRIAA